MLAATLIIVKRIVIAKLIWILLLNDNKKKEKAQ